TASSRRSRMRSSTCRTGSRGCERAAPGNGRRARRAEAVVTSTPDLPFLAGYPEQVLDQVRALIAREALAPHLELRYPERHLIRSDGALYEHAMALKQRYLRNAPPLSRVAYDGRLQIDLRALGTLTAVSRVQGGRLKAKREIRVAAVF